jgi:hypothetical protein
MDGVAGADGVVALSLQLESAHDVSSLLVARA